jgi:branched-chain amino acid transport system permease protein
LAGSVAIGDLRFPTYRFAIIIIGLIIAFGLWWFLEKTRAGAIVRAGMDDKQMIMGLGVNYALVSTTVFFLGALMGGFAGLIGSPILGAQVDMSFPIVLLAMIVIVVGGMGTIQGALLGSIVIGLLDTLGKSFFPDLAMFTIYLVFIIILLVRPSGLLQGRRI